MNKKAFPPTPDAVRTLTDHDFFKQCLVRYGSCDLFADTEEWLSADNPYRRTLRPHVFRHLDFSRPAGQDELLNYTALTANRLLLTIYEQDFVLLPPTGFASKHTDFEAFYSRDQSVLGAIIRPWLERYLFGFLDEEIAVSGNWTLPAMEEYFRTFIRESLEQTANPVTQATVESVNPQHAAKTFLIQLAGDFLLEASAMARNVMGHYGPIQSELFKILIDEFGYGVHKAKHSTLFERTLSSIGLDPAPHAYWQFYLTSSMLLNNYFNYVCRDHRFFFRYLGAIFRSETMFIQSCRHMAGMMRTVFGPEAEVEYFLEHVHIDGHHSRMVLEKLLIPAVKTFGTVIIPEILRGFEESGLIAEIADKDLINQIHWSDGGPYFKNLADPIYARILDGSIDPPRQQFIEPRGELSVTHVHDGDELCRIEKGVMHFVTGHDRYTVLEAGQGTVIQRNRLHGAIIESPECVYTIYSIGDHRRCLS